MSALGVAVTGLLGSSLFATVVDSATSTGNSIESGGLAAPPADLRAGLLDDGEPCGPEATTDDTTFAAAVDSAEIILARNSQVASETICLYNAGGTTGATAMQFTSVFDGEANEVDGTCDNAEATPTGGQDQTCAAGDPGELSEIFEGYVRYLLPCPDNQECVFPTPYFDFDATTATPLSLFGIEPGESLAIQLSFVIDDAATDQELQAAQTDRLQFDIAFSFQEPAA